MGCKRCKHLSTRRCAFCGKGEGPGLPLIRGRDVAICADCATAAFHSVMDYDDANVFGADDKPRGH